MLDSRGERRQFLLPEVLESARTLLRACLGEELRIRQLYSHEV